MAYTPEQRRNLAIARRKTRRDSPRVRMALIEAGFVESNWRHLNYGDRDSQGVLQQRSSQGWGPYIPGARGVAQDIDDFLLRARRTDRGFKGTPGQLAQAVQRSAFPSRYDQQAEKARAVLGSKLASSPGLAVAERLGAFGGRTAASQPSSGTNPLFASLIQSSNELAQGRMPDPNSLVMALAEARQAAEQPSPEAQTLARGERPNYGKPRGGGITYSGEKTTHDTDGLPGYPAIDQFAKPGTPFTAPEDGKVVRHSGSGGTSGSVYGYSVYFQGKSGKKYFITHLGPERAPVGARLRRGQQVGRISPWTGGAPHAHVGIRG